MCVRARRTYGAGCLIDGSIVPGQVANAAQPGFQYVAFTDPSGGRSDAFTLAIAHGDTRGRMVLDKLLIEPPPFDPGKVAERFGEALGAYGLDRVTGDRYGGDWVPSTFARFGIRYEPASHSKSEIYSEVLPLFTASRVDLLDIDGSSPNCACSSGAPAPAAAATSSTTHHGHTTTRPMRRAVPYGSPASKFRRGTVSRGASRRPTVITTR